MGWSEPENIYFLSHDIRRVLYMYIESFYPAIFPLSPWIVCSLCISVLVFFSLFLSLLPSFSCALCMLIICFLASQRAPGFIFTLHILDHFSDCRDIVTIAIVSEVSILVESTSWRCRFIRECGITLYVGLAHAAPPTQYKAFMAFSTNWLSEGSTSR